MTRPPLTPERADAILEASRRPRPSTRMWGAKKIGNYLGVSADTVRAWAKLPGVPIYQPLPRCYVADKIELDPWLRTKSAA